MIYKLSIYLIHDKNSNAKQKGKAYKHTRTDKILVMPKEKLRSLEIDQV